MAAAAQTECLGLWDHVLLFLGGAKSELKCIIITDNIIITDTPRTPERTRVSVELLVPHLQVTVIGKDETRVHE